MSYSVKVQFSSFQNLDSAGKKEGEVLYGYRIYSTCGKTEYSNAYDTKELLLEEVDKYTILDVIDDNHPAMLDIIQAEGGFVFNDEVIDIADVDEDYVEPHNSDDDDDLYGQELFDGDEEVAEEVEEILEEAAENLIS